MVMTRKDLVRFINHATTIGINHSDAEALRCIVATSSTDSIDVIESTEIDNYGKEHITITLRYVNKYGNSCICSLCRDTGDIFQQWYRTKDVNFYYLTGKEFKEVFERFNFGVNSGLYEKMSYSSWKVIREVVVRTNEKSKITVCITNGSDLSCTYTDSADGTAMTSGVIDAPQFITLLRNMFDNNPTEDINEEENTMNMFKNFDFGSCEGDAVRFSPFGLAVKNQSGTWVSYNKDTHDLVDVDVFNFDGSSKFFYKVPVAISQIQVGDIVIHQRKPMVVMDVMNDTLNVIDPVAGEAKTIVLTKSMFGFNFVTKVISLVDFGGTANAENPFGNILPFLLMSEDKDIDPMMMLALSGGLGAEMNPLMLYALAGDRKGNDMLPLLMMTNKDMFKF